MTWMETLTRSMDRRWGAELGQIALLAAAYVATAKLSLLLAVPPGYATAVWPPSGIALTALLLAGTRIWPGVWLGAALANLSIEGSPLLAVLIATGNTLESVAGAALIRRYAGSRPFASGHQVVAFVASCALCATVAAGIGVSALALKQGLSWPDFFLNLWTWWQGDASGMMLVTPLIMSWRGSQDAPWSWQKAIEAVALVTSAAIAAFLIFGGAPSEATNLPLAFLALPFIVWAAIRFTEREVATVVAIICGIAMAYTVQGRGAFGVWPANTALLLLLAYTSTLVMTGLVSSAVIRERERATAELRQIKQELERRVDDRTRELEQANQSLRRGLEERNRHWEKLRESEERFRVLVDGVKDYAIFSLDADGKVASWNTGAQQIKGYAASEIIGSHFSRFYTPEDLARRWPDYELAVARAEGRFEDEGWRVRKDGSRFWANVIISRLVDSEQRVVGFAKVTRDLTARRHMEAMQESERQMSEFLAMLGHELRNPLSAIVNALGVMRSNPAQEVGEAREVIDRQVTHLARIVDDLLDVSRITRGKITLRNEILDLNALVERIVESCRPMADERGHALDLRLADGEVWVDADSTRLSQVVLNLITNAVKYTPEGGSIFVALEREAGNAVLHVRDNGIGIDAELLPRIFDLFVQGESSLARTDGGLGIGLTLVKQLIEVQRGSVQAFSDGPGKGSEFVVRLPLASAPDQAREPAAQVLDLPHANRRRLLVVDDNRDSANMLAALLEVMGHDARTAHDGHDALAIAAEYHPDAIFLDIGLPGMNGYEVARSLRSSPALASVVLIAFTGYGQDEDRRQVKEAGFDHHLVKPSGASELAKIIDALPGRS